MPEQQRPGQRDVLNPQPIFNGMLLMETKVFAGETLSELVQRSAEARRCCGIQEDPQLNYYHIEILRQDGTADCIHFDCPIELGGEYVIHPYLTLD